MTIADQIDSYLRTQLAKIRLGASIGLHSGGTYTFQTDAGQQVDKHLEYTEHADIMPSIVFYTGSNASDEDETVELGMEKHTLEISIEGFIEDDKAGSQLDALKNDISAAIKADPWFGGLLDQIQGFKSDGSTQVGDTIFSIAKVDFQVVYVAPYGAE